MYNAVNIKRNLLEDPKPWGQETVIPSATTLHLAHGHSGYQPNLGRTILAKLEILPICGHQEETAVSTRSTHEKKPFLSHSLKATSVSPGHAGEIDQSLATTLAPPTPKCLIQKDKFWGTKMKSSRT